MKLRLLVAMAGDIMTKMSDIQWKLTASPDVIPCFVVEHRDARCIGFQFIVKTLGCRKAYEQDGQQLDKIPLIELPALESKWIQKKKTLCQNPRKRHASKAFANLNKNG